MSAIENMKNKAQEMAREHRDQIEEKIDKAAELADNKTGGKHSDKVEQGVEKAKGLLGKLAK